MVAHRASSVSPQLSSTEESAQDIAGGGAEGIMRRDQGNENAGAEVSDEVMARLWKLTSWKLRDIPESPEGQMHPPRQ